VVCSRGLGGIGQLEVIFFLLALDGGAAQHAAAPGFEASAEQAGSEAPNPFEKQLCFLAAHGVWMGFTINDGHLDLQTGNKSEQRSGPSEIERLPHAHLLDVRNDAQGRGVSRTLSRQAASRRLVFPASAGEKAQS